MCATINATSRFGRAAAVSCLLLAIGGAGSGIAQEQAVIDQIDELGAPRTDQGVPAQGPSRQAPSEKPSSSGKQDPSGTWKYFGDVNYWSQKDTRTSRGR